jgi:tetratricopeptide (TPR) repeat protein
MAVGSADRKNEFGLRSAPPAQMGIFARSGDIWTVSYSGKTFSLKDAKGLGYIQRLLQHPGEEFHALDLLSGPAAVMNTEGVVSIPRPGDAGEMLDARTKQDYRRRLLELREELEDLRERGDHEGAAKVKFELDFLVRELARAVGLGGRDRRAGSAAERARLSVTRAIKAALQKISEHHSSLGEVLGRSVRTGLFCCYVVDPRVPISWRFLLEDAKPSVEPEATAPLLLRSETRLLYALQSRTAFVGREAELSLMRRHLEQTLRGGGRVVTIAGAPGVGKSRIANEVSTDASQRGFLVLTGNCYDLDDSVPFIPFVEIFEAALACAASPEVFREALGENATAIARVMPQLRRLFPDIPPPPQISPEQSRRILFNAVAELLAHTAATRPVLLLLEDLHWADQGTLSLLDHLVGQLAGIPVMIIATYRDSEIDAGGSLVKTLGNLIRLHLVERISLGGLPQSAVAEMIRSLSGREPPQALVTVIHSHTEGNPFFIEELFRHLVERGKLTEPNGDFRAALNLTDIDVPQSLRIVVGRRLARLNQDTQKALSTAAVIGRSFTFELLEASTRANADSLLDSLDEAERAGLISSTLQYPEARFKFAHELIRQAVTTGLSAARRQRLHLNVADAIERIYSKELEVHVDDLAHQLWQAGAAADATRTVRYLQMAGEEAVKRSANVEAVSHFNRGLELLRTNHALPDRAQQELSLQLALGVPLVLTKGHSAPEVEATYNRARELCQQATEGPELFSVLLGLRRFYFNRGELQPALELGTQLLSLAQTLRDSSLLARAHLMQGEALFLLGDFVKAKDNFEQGVAFYNASQHRSDSFLYGNDTGGSCLSYEALVLWLLGFPDKALKMSQQALTLAREIAHPFNLAFALTWASFLHQLRGQEQLAWQQAEEVVSLANKHGFPLWGAWGAVLRGWAVVRKGRGEEGIQEIVQGLEAWCATGAQIARPWMLTPLSDSYRGLGQTGEGLSVVAEALAGVEKTGEHQYEAELYRLKGELLLPSTRVSRNQDESATREAESCFREAIEIARRQQAKSLELRSSTSLSRLWQQRGKKQQARRMLAEIYGWFTEGFDTSDLKEAKALLEELD